MTRVSIIGTGAVGKALEAGLQGKGGYEVRSASHDEREVRDAAAWGDVIILAVPLAAVDDVLKTIGDGGRGKVVVDVTNDFGETPPTSRAEELQAKAPAARVVKAFNTVFAKHMASGKVKGEAVSLFVAGDDASAKKQVMDLGRSIGFLPVDAGPLKNSRFLESLGMLNIKLGFGPSKYGEDIGFRLVGA